MPGVVYLVGAGPGDPDLLTLRAVKLMHRADVVLHDHLVSPEVLALVPGSTRRIAVGKRCGDHTLAQEAINALMVRLARAGQQVLRLKGGDPYVFGRGGEEAEWLARHGVAFEVVPGITAAAGAAAYAGFPLTHRDFAHACVLVAAHGREGMRALDWPALARPGQTLVFYMGLRALPLVCAELVRHGRAPATPAAVVQQATTPVQRIVAATLAALPQRAAQARLHAPALIVVGEVVGLRERLQRLAADATCVPAPAQAMARDAA
jgi:uroporphyrin-III C-methyltransferase/precorrin-2 dehydrogenase/sirohydrochlorin ferrochelatase